MMLANPSSYPNLSYWEKETFFKDIDIAIIGSGIVGLNTAIRLKEMDKNLRIIILERGTLPMGASTKNAGFACFGSLSELIEDLKTHSISEVLTLVEKRWKGLERLRARVGDAAMDYQAHGGYELFRKEDKLRYQECLEQMDFFNRELSQIIGQKEVFKSKDQQIGSFGFKNVNHLIHNVAEGQIHTGKMMQQLIDLARAKGVRIYTGISITGYEENAGKVVLKNEKSWLIEATKVVVATNGFAKELIPNLSLRPARNQVLITKPIKKLAIKGCFHYECGYFYFRNIDQRILLGGGRHLAEKEEETAAFGWTALIRNALENLLKEVILPEQTYEIDHHWSGVLGIGNQKKAIIKFVSPNVLVAARLGGMGIAIGSLVGEAAAERLLEG